MLVLVNDEDEGGYQLSGSRIECGLLMQCDRVTEGMANTSTNSSINAQISRKCRVCSHVLLFLYFEIYIEL